MPLARQRDASDVDAILTASEMPAQGGHAIARHVQINDHDLQGRVTGENLEFATRFASHTDLVGATLELLNSPVGQHALAELDNGQTRSTAIGPIRGTFYADYEFGDTFKFPNMDGQSTRGLTTTSHMGSGRTARVRQVTVVLRRPVGGNLRIVTSYPSATD
jgi:hypothetical protein